MDPANPIVKLCTEAMQAEMQGRPAEALALLEQAWAQRQDDFDACVTAHFLARHQPAPRDMLDWNQQALDFANAAAAQPGGLERVRTFYPSLYLNLGYSHETLGDLAEARRCYHLALEKTGDLAGDGYGDIVRTGILEGLRRTQ